MTKIVNVITASRALFASPKYRLVLGGTTLAFALMQIWLANYSLILFVYQSDAFSWRDRISILGSTIALFFTGAPLTVQLFTFVTAALVGLNIALLAFYFKKRLELQTMAGTGAVGMFASLLGVGCTSCGSVILSSLVGFSATTKFLTALPLQGQEFSLFAIFMLTVSIYFVAQKIVNPLTCATKK